MRSWVVAIGLGLCLHAGRALAHDPPQITSVLWDEPHDQLVLRTNRGFIFGSQEKGWKLLCHAAPGVTTYEHADLDFARLPDGRLLVATSGGLLASPGNGCAFTGVAPFETVFSSALAQAPDDPSKLYLATAQSPDYDNAVFISDDGGASWNAGAPIASGLFFDRLAVSPADPERLYAVGSEVRGSKLVYFVGRSDDGGLSFTRSDAPMIPGEAGLSLVALHPGDPDRLLVRTLDNDPTRLVNRLLASDDGGESFDEVFSEAQLWTAAYANDSDTIWAGGAIGLSRAEDAADFTALPPAERVSYLGQHGDELFVGGYYHGIDAGLDGLGASRDQGAGIDPIMRFEDVTEQACDASTPSGMACTVLWHDWGIEILGASGKPPEGGAGGGGAAGRAALGGAGGTGGTGSPPAADGGVTPDEPRDDGGCGVAARPRFGSPGLALALFALAVAVRAHRRRGRMQV